MTELYKNPLAPEEERVSDLLRRMTADEKIAQITMLTNRFDELLNLLDSGTLPPEGVGTAYIMDCIDPADFNRLQRHQLVNTRLGIPLLLAGESIHGLAYTGATVFPQAIGIASAFDTELMSAIADVIGQEAEAAGVRQCYAPNLDISRDPRWGRTEENYGECPYLTSRLGTAYIKSVQAHHVAATPKHYIAHGSPEGGVNTSPSHVGEREVREVMLDPFDAAVREAGCMSVMPAYSELDGIPMHASPYWLNDILRGELGFDGYICSDHSAINLLRDEHRVVETPAEAGRLALNSGVDTEAPVEYGFGSTLKAELEAGRVSEEAVDRAVANLLRVKFRLGLFEQPYASEEKVRGFRSEASLRLARRAAAESVVLLKNEGVLPLANTVKKLAVVGPGADHARLGGYTAKGSDRYAVTLRQALVERLGTESILYANGTHIAAEDDIGSAVEAVRGADAAIVVLCDNSSCYGLEPWGDEEGTRCVTCGENYDCLPLQLPEPQRNLLRAVRAVGKPVVLILETGRPYCIADECALSDAVIQAWYPGEQGGYALSDILFGVANPCGKLPITFPKSVGHLPCFYNYKPTARGIVPIELDGRTENPSALFPFGFGLSYTAFEYSDLSVDGRNVSVTVRNAGERAGKEAVLMFITQHFCPVTPFVRRLRGFRKILLAPGESREISFTLTDDDLSYIGTDMKKTLGTGGFTVAIGSLTADFRVD